jgi:hypothetical protein
MRKRLLQLAVGALVLLCATTAAGYFGMRVGRSFQLNQMKAHTWMQDDFYLPSTSEKGH